MALQGNLKDFSLIQLLNLINLTHKSGRLTIEHGNQTTDLYFQEGRLLFALIHGALLSLDQVLLQAGKLSNAQAQELTTSGDLTDKGLAKHLVESGLLAQEDVLQQLRNRTIETVYTLFTWQEGSFCFESNVALPDEYIAAPTRLESIIIEGSRRVQEWEKLNQQVPDLNVVVRIVAQPAGAPGRQISLSMDEWVVVPMIAEGRYTITQIARHHAMDDYKMRKVIYRLLSNGLVEVAAEPEPARTAGGRAPYLRATTSSGQQHDRRNIVLRWIDRIRGS